MITVMMVRTCSLLIHFSVLNAKSLLPVFRPWSCLKAPCKNLKGVMRVTNDVTHYFGC